ncbi:MAG: hypothetical protein ABIK31_01720, partial [candidate division WOR-3 bacterium]
YLFVFLPLIFVAPSIPSNIEKTATNLGISINKIEIFNEQLTYINHVDLLNYKTILLPRKAAMWHQKMKNNYTEKLMSYRELSKMIKYEKKEISTYLPALAVWIIEDEIRYLRFFDTLSFGESVILEKQGVKINLLYKTKREGGYIYEIFALKDSVTYETNN